MTNKQEFIKIRSTIVAALISIQKDMLDIGGLKGQDEQRTVPQNQFTTTVASCANVKHTE